MAGSLNDLRSSNLLFNKNQRRNRRKSHFFMLFRKLCLPDSVNFVNYATKANEAISKAFNHIGLDI